jgi:type I restriction enzyme S subunit
MTPEGWLWGTLADLCSFEYGKSLPAESREGGPIPVFGSNGIVGYHNKALVGGPGIVVGRKGSIGEVEWCDSNFWPIDTTYYVVPRGTRELKWLLHLLKSLELRKLNTATGIPGLNREDAYALQLRVPPLLEQRKIAAILSSVDEAIEGTQAVIGQTQVVKKAMMADLLTRGIPGRHKTFRQTEIGEVPEDWDIVPLEALAERICVGIVVRPASYYTATGVLCLRGKNIKEDRLVLDDVVFISKASNVLLGKSMLRAGDVVTVRTGEPGTSCVIPDALDGANCIDIIITTPGSRIDSHFLSRFLNSAEGRAVVATGKGGLAQQHFNVGAMKEMPVPVPDRKEQQAIVAALSAIDGRLAQETGAIEGLRQLKSALMSVLLTGEVRVCVDEEDAA